MYNSLILSILNMKTEGIKEKILSANNITINGFKNKKEVEEFVLKFPKYTKLKVSESVSGTIREPIATFYVSSAKEFTGGNNELGTKRRNSLIKTLEKMGMI